MVVPLSDLLVSIHYITDVKDREGRGAGQKAGQPAGHFPSHDVLVGLLQSTALALDRSPALGQWLKQRRTHCT